MRDPLSWMSVRWKLALMFVVVCLLAFGVGGYLVSSSAKSALEQEIHGRLEFQCRSYADALDANLRLLARRIEDFASDGYIRSRMAALAGAPPEDEAQRLRSELRRHLTRNKLPLVPAFIDLVLVGADRRVLMTVRDETSPLVETVAAEALRNESSWYSDLLPASSVDEFPTMAVATPVSDLEGTRDLGRIVGWVHPGVWIAESLNRGAEAPPEVSGTVFLSLADRTGRRLTVPASYTKPEAVAPGSELVRSGFGLRLAESGPGQGALEEGSGLKWFARSLTIPASAWSAGVRVEAEQALSSIAGLQSRFLGIGAVLAALAGLLLFFPMRFLARPLVELRNAAWRIRAGDFGTRVEAGSQDEIGDLASSFNLMAEAIEERTGRLESAAHELQEGQIALKRERDRLNAVIQSMRDGLLVLDGDGQQVYANQGAEPLAALLEGDGPLAASRHTCHDAREGGTDCSRCLFDPAAPPRSCVLNVGSAVYEVHSTFLPAGRSGRRGRVLVSRDVTDRVAQDDRHIHQERLAVLGEVAAVMAHELNNPLAAISMFNQMLLAELPEESPLRENAEVIRRNTETCKQTIRQLLDYSTGAMPELEAMDLHAVLADAARFLAPVGERAGVEWRWRLEAADPRVTGDEIQIRQVFVNLAMNAIQAMEGAGGTLSVSTREEEGSVVVELADSGPGIPAGSRADVFRPFFTTKDRGEGTGLGLSTARRIAEMHGGSVELARTGDDGTVFRVRLRKRVEAARRGKTAVETA